MTGAGTVAAFDRTTRRVSTIERLLADAIALVDGFSTQSPVYDVLPSSLVDADFVPAAELNVRLFFRFWLDGNPPTEEDTRPLVNRAVSLLHDGMPLEEVLGNYRAGVDFLWSQLPTTASPAGRAALAEIGRPLSEYLSLMTARIAMACVEDARRRPSDELERRRGIVDALLAGRDPGDWLDDPTVPVADAFVVAVIRPGDPGPGTLTELRHRIHDLPGAFLRRDIRGWTALIPIDSRADSAAVIENLSTRLVPGIGTGATPLWIGVSPAVTRAAIPESFAEARVVAELGRCLARSEVICRRQDLRLEYAVAVDGSVRKELASVLEPLADQPVLAETLGVFFANECNQNAAARLLFVHRNTITYRLARIAELTGYDPQRPTEAMTLSAARTAQLLEAKAFSA
ncbi:PucR family transcriptional regulator [Nocardia colli]|uniref:PucR family transcriptional regulator n=1 Tax=Nocardia colli TaxID=2545717 RepID=A0A5N0EA95_9NOCA|nr:PucR family transcriptional regulator [Nocardia colli]KAA8885389.1 PucR family transcriptional regulator [Nocardia colli]